MSKINKKIKLAWSVLSSGVVVDQQTNNISLFNVIEEITIPKDKLLKLKTDDGKNMLGVPVSFNLLSVWRRIGKSGLISADIKVQIFDPTGKTRDVSNEPIQLAEKIQRLRLIMKWAGIKVGSSGIYTFKILKKEKGEKSFSEAGTIDLKINIVEEVKQPKISRPKVIK